MFKKKDDGDKKSKGAPKPTIKPKMKAASPGLKKALGVDSLQSGKFYPYTKEALARRDSAKATPRATATIQKSTMNSKTGAVTKSAPKKMGMKSITAKEFYK